MRVTVRLDDSLAEHVEAVRPDADDSDAEAVRECIRRSRRLDDAEERVDELESGVERVKREKRLILEEREEKRELARYAEDKRTAEQRRREAGLATRARWFLFGEDRDDQD